MAFVLDASATLPWCFQDEATPSTEALLQRASDRELLVVPAHWSTEVLNVLLQAQRRGRLTTADFDAFLVKLAEFNIDAESPILDLYLPSVRSIAERYRLSSYDAAYLELAKRRRLPFATFDKELIRAAIAEDVPLVFQESVSTG